MAHIVALERGLDEFVGRCVARGATRDAVLVETQSHADAVLGFEYALAEECSPSTSTFAGSTTTSSRRASTGTAPTSPTRTASSSALSPDGRARLRALISTAVIASSDSDRVAAVDAVASAVHRSLQALAHSGRDSASADTSPHSSRPSQSRSQPSHTPALVLEELLSHILTFALDLSNDDLIAQAHATPASAAAAMPAYRPGILRVCKRWNRVAAPLLFRCVVFRRVRDVTAFMHAVAVRTSQEDQPDPVQQQLSSAPALVPQTQTQSTTAAASSHGFGRHVRKLVICDTALVPGGVELVQYTLARTPNLEHLFVNLWNTAPFIVATALDTTTASRCRTTHILDAQRFNPLGIQWAFARWRDFLRARLQDARNTADADTEIDSDLDPDSEDDDDDGLSTDVDADVRPSRVATVMRRHAIDDLLDGVPTRASFACRALEDASGRVELRLHMDVASAPASMLLSPSPSQPQAQALQLGAPPADVCPHRALIWFAPVAHPGPFGDNGGFVPSQHWPDRYTVDDFGPLRMTLSFDTGGRPPLNLA